MLLFVAVQGDNQIHVRIKETKVKKLALKAQAKLE